MRVLFNTYPWAFATPGGGEMQLLKYAEHLPRHGVEVAFYNQWKPAFDRVDAVHFFSCIGGSVHFCNYVRNRGLALVVSPSLWLTEDTIHFYPVDEIRAMLALADVIVPNSRAEADALARILRLPRERFIPIMNGVDPRFAAPIDAKIFRDRFAIDGPFVLSVGNVEPRKNQLNLVRAMHGHELPLVLIGHVREEDYAARVGVEGGARLHFLGPIGHDDPALASAYAAAAAFVLPSSLETPGLAALEAAAAGSPLVITSEGPTREYFGELAEYVNPKDTSDIRRGIDVAIARGPDPALKSHVTRNLLWADVTAALPQVYRTAASHQQSRADPRSG